MCNITAINSTEKSIFMLLLQLTINITSKVSNILPMDYLYIFLYKNSQNVTNVKHFQTNWRSGAWEFQTHFRRVLEETNRQNWAQWWDQINNK